MFRALWSGGSHQLGTIHKRSLVRIGSNWRCVRATQSKPTRGARAAAGASQGLRLERFQTAEGVEVTVAPRGRVPLVAVRLVLEVGAAVDPPGQEGLADFMVRLLRRGTERRDAHAIDEAVEFVGASLGLYAGEDHLALTLTTPAEHLRPMLEVLSELVQVPSFPETEVATERERSLGQFANDVDDPSLLADRALVRTAWAGHPYGHDVTGTRAFGRPVPARRRGALPPASTWAWLPGSSWSGAVDAARSAVGAPRPAGWSEDRRAGRGA